MATTQDEFWIHDVAKKYDSQSWQIKDLISNFESAKQDMISNKQKIW